jgi:hypothetical protein
MASFPSTFISLSEEMYIVYCLKLSKRLLVNSPYYNSEVIVHLKIHCSSPRCQNCQSI